MIPKNRSTIHTEEKNKNNSVHYLVPIYDYLYRILNIITNMLYLHTTHNTQEKKMSSNNPYALRANLLSQAEGILMQRYQVEHDKAREHMHLRRARDKAFDVSTVTWPEFPTTDDIIAEAEKLYSFVQKK